jgi:uncharacterized protein YydD (DUF2326 family)
MIHCVLHDSRIFDGIDPRQTKELFKIADDLFTNSDYQYIATVNQNQLEEIKSLMSENEYTKIVTDNIILTLTDESDAGKLLGIRVDLLLQ